MQIVHATFNQLEKLAPLFDAYRVFYEAPSQPEAARKFMDDRLRLQDSVIFLAINAADSGLGFVQLYSVFSSISMQRAYLLNDLFVLPEFATLMQKKRGCMICFCKPLTPTPKHRQSTNIWVGSWIRLFVFMNAF